MAGGALAPSTADADTPIWLRILRFFFFFFFFFRVPLLLLRLMGKRGLAFEYLLGCTYTWGFLLYSGGIERERERLGEGLE